METVSKATNPSSKELRKIFESIENIPSLPTVVQDILMVTEDPKSGARDVQAVVENDQSCSVKLLKLANSAYYGFSRQVSSIREAIVIIGLEGVKNVAMSLGVAECFLELDEADQKKLTDLWVHSMATATASQLLANDVPGISPSFAYCAGLIHDFGKVLLANHFKEKYAEAYRQAKENKKTMTETETAVLGVSHEKVAGWVANVWELPDAVREAVEYHQKGLEGQAISKHVTLVAIANALAYESQVGDGGNGKPRQVDVRDLSRIGLKQSHKETVIAEIKENSARFTTLLNMAR